MSLLSLLADAPDFSKTADLVVVLLNAILSPVSIIAGAICILYIIKHGLKLKNLLMILNNEIFKFMLFADVFLG